MAEKAITAYDDEIMDAVSNVLMAMLGVTLLCAILPITQYGLAQVDAQNQSAREATIWLMRF